jgi:hypothetical protein
MQTPITLTFEPNFETASVYVEYTSMQNTRVHGTVRYRTSGRDWMTGHGLVDLPRNALAPALPPTLGTSLFGLIPGEQVEVQVTFIRESTIDGTVLETQTKTNVFSTRSDSFPSSGNTRYVSINGDDDNDGTSPAEAWRTLLEASRKATLQAGDTIIMLPGDYAFFDVSNPYLIGDTTINGLAGAKSGNAGAYITLQAETPGGVKIRGSKKLNLMWDPYEIPGMPAPPYPHCYKSTTQVTERINRMRLKTNPATDVGTILYPYVAERDSGGPPPNSKFGMGDHPWPGWYQDASGYIYIKLNSGAATGGPTPQTDQLSAAAASTSGLYLIDVHHWKIEGIVFEDFGLQDTNHEVSGLVNYRGLKVSGAADIVVDGCTFRDCGFISAESGVPPTVTDSGNVTIQNCRFEASGIWEVCNDTNDKDGWSYGKFSPLAVFSVFYQNTRGMVIRRNTFDGTYYAITSGVIGQEETDEQGTDVDIYDNTFARISGDNMQIEDVGFGLKWRIQHTRIFRNESTLTNFGLSLSPLNVGPVFFVANKSIDFVDYAIKPGNANLPTDPSAAWKFVYHNTFKSDIVQAQGFGSYAFTVNVVTGNIVAVNNIFQGTKREIVHDISFAMMTAPNAFIRNVLFSTSATTPHRLRWRGIDYEKNPPTHLTAEQRLMDSLTGEPAVHPNELVFFDRNIEEINPFPSGGNTALNPALESQAVSIPGITNIAGTAGGVHLTEPLAVGQFGSFTMPPRVTSPTATLMRRLIPAIMLQQTPR